MPMLGCWWLQRPGMGVVNGCFGTKRMHPLNLLATTSCLLFGLSAVPRCLGLRSGQLVLRCELLIGDGLFSDEMSPAVGTRLSS